MAQVVERLLLFIGLRFNASESREASVIAVRDMIHSFEKKGKLIRWKWVVFNYGSG